MGAPMKLLVPFVAVLALSACGAPASQPQAESSTKAGSQPQVGEAKVRLPAAPGLPGAGYFQLTGFGGSEVLTGASSPAAERIELHLTSEENGVSRMRKLDQISLPTTGTLAFEPGAHHLMLFGLRDGLQAGQTIPLTLTFAKAQPVTVEARLEAPGGGMEGHHGGH